MWATMMVLALGMMASGLGGCAAGVVAPVGGDVAGAVVGKSDELFWRGKVEADEAVSFDETVGAAKTAADELKLTTKGQEKHESWLKLKYRDDRKDTVEVTLTRRTAKLTEIRTDVGFFGSAAFARTVMRQILDDLPDHGKTEHKEDKGEK